MYRNREDLGNLIDSLSAGEKRYFYDFYKSGNTAGVQPLFVRLFHALSNHESELSNILTPSPQALTTTKKRLHKNILKSLRNLHEGRSADAMIQNQLEEVEILYHLSLPEQAAFILNKCHQVAKEHERFGLLLHMLEWEKRLHIVLDKPQRNIKDIVEEEREVLAQIKQVTDMESIYSNATLFKKEFGYAKGKLKQELEVITIRSVDMPALEGCLSHKAIFYYNYIHALYHWMVMDHQSAYNYSRHLLLPAIEVLPSYYIEGIREHVISCICMRLFEDALDALHIGESYIEAQKLNPSYTLLLKMRAYNAIYRMIIYSYMGERNKLQTIVSETEIQLERYQKMLPFETTQVIMGNLLNAYTGLADMEKGDEIRNLLLNKHSKSIRRDIYADLYIHRLFSLLQSKTYVLLSSAALSALRYYHKLEDARISFEVEFQMASLLTREQSFEQPQILQQTLFKMKKAVTDYLDRLTGIKNFQVHYTWYVIWIDSLINDRPFYEEAAIWYKSYQSG